jgi:hypothetical protein
MKRTVSREASGAPHSVIPAKEHHPGKIRDPLNRTNREVLLARVHNNTVIPAKAGTH